MQILSLTNCPLDARLGSGKTVIQFSEGLRRLGHTVDVLAPDQCELWPGVRRAKQLRQGLGALGAVAGAMRRRHYDLIEFYGAEFWPVALKLSRRARRPLMVAHTNGLELLHYERERRFAGGPGFKASISRAAHEPLLRTSFACTDGFVALCEADRQYVMGKGLYAPPMTAVVEPGLDDEFRTALDRSTAAREARVCFTGSWLPRKGVATLVAVMSRVLRAHPDARFEVFGAHENRAQAAASFPADVRPRVTVHPELSRSELASRLQTGRVFIFPSEYEGFGLGLAEAMACGLAAVTTPTGFGASLTPGTDAIVCGFGEVECLATGVLRLLSDETLRSRLASNGRTRVRGLTWESSAVQLASVYASWVAGGPATVTGSHVDRG
jgi:glycosyltransferase involved in cell wall biosynthesis